MDNKKRDWIDWLAAVAAVIFALGMPWGHVSGYIACGFGLVAYFASLGSRRFGPRTNCILLTMTAFLAWGTVLSLTVAGHPGPAVKAVFTYASHWLFPLILGLIMPRRMRVRFIFLWIISLAVLGSVSLPAYLGWIDSPRLSSEGLLKGLHTHIQLAALLLIGLHLALAGVLTRGLSLSKTVVFGAMGLLFAFFMVLTGSRGIWFAGAISVAGAIIHNMIAGRRRRLALIFLAVAAIAAATAIAAFPQVRARIGRTGTDDPSYIYRRNMATMACKIIRDHPVLGIGPGQVPYAKDYYELMNRLELPVETGYLHKRHLHDVYLQIFSEFGIAGIVLFVSIIVFVFRALAGSLRTADGLSRALVYGAIWAFAGVVTGDILDCLFRGPPVAMEIFWIVGAAVGTTSDKNGG